MAESGASMRATIIENIGKSRALKSLRLTRPQPAAGEALVKVHATSVNPQDLLYRSGKLIIRKPMPHILGGDLAGEIVKSRKMSAIGQSATAWPHASSNWEANAMAGMPNSAAYPPISW